MTRVKMISGREFDQLFATGKSLRQLVGEIESADDKRSDQHQDGAAENEQDNDEPPRRNAVSDRNVRQPTKSQRDQTSR